MRFVSIGDEINGDDGHGPHDPCLRRNVLISMLVVVRLLWLLREWEEAVVLPCHEKAIK